MQHHLEPKYLARLAKLEHLHPSAFRFLTRLQTEGPAHDLRLSTSTNAHVYKAAGYLMHIKLQGLRREPTSIVLSPTLHIMIEQDAVDRSELLFPTTIKKLVMEHGGFKAGWAQSPAGVDIELKASTPDSFFEAVLSTLRELDVQT